MNILCIGYYDKHSRFFLGIKKQLQKETYNLNFKINSIHLSGFLYTFLRFQYSIWLPMKVWLRAIKNKKKYITIIDSSDIYKNICYKTLIKFHDNLNAKISKKNLLIQTLSYIDFFEEYLNENEIDLILLIGDSRLCIEVCIALCKKSKIKIYFIEQGPFNTTIFNDTGVNANIQINPNLNAIPSHETDVTIKKLLNSSKNKKYNRFFVYRGLDFLIMKIINNCYLFPPDLKFTDVLPSFFKNSKNISPTKRDRNNKIYLLVLQVPMDVNMIYHSPNFKNHYEIVKSIHENLPINAQLLIREHPIFRGKYEKELYEYLNDHNLAIDKNKNINASLKLADVVIVNNSTVGLQAITFQKPVVVLGNAYYDNSKICLKYNSNNNLKYILNISHSFKPEKNIIFSFLNEFFFKYSVAGNIDDQNLIAAKTISDIIKQNFNQQIINNNLN